MKIIYTPRGRAYEYSPLAANIYSGCSHGCRYCYAPTIPPYKFKARECFHQHPQPRKDLLRILEKDLQEYHDRKLTDRVLLCFTSDPYQGSGLFNQLTRQALQLFRQHNVPFQILTKGGLKASRDFDLYSPQDAFATTLTFLSPQKSQYWEPEATLPQSRMQALIEAHEKGIETWVSFEPVLDAQEVFSLLQKTAPFVDLYKVGKCSGNYSSVADWHAFGHCIIDQLERLDKAYYIKDDLKKHL